MMIGVREKVYDIALKTSSLTQMNTHRLGQNIVGQLIVRQEYGIFYALPHRSDIA
jgi:hypothetical protein